MYKGYDYAKNRWVALKQISMDNLTSDYGEEFKNIVLSEISIMRKFSRKMEEAPCEFIVKHEDCFRT